MSVETKHLIKWWFEWLKRLIRTSYHIINRKAYHKFKDKQYNNHYFNDDFRMPGEDEFYH